MLEIYDMTLYDLDMELNMSFREKMHWAAFIGIAGAFGWYFATYPWAIAGTSAGIGAIAGMLLQVTIIIIALMSVTAATLAFRFPKEANLKEDERERAIHLKGTHAAYYPLVIGSYGIMGALFNQLSTALMINLVLAVVISAELVRVGAQLWLYRRGN
jgi:hypothetical protein